MKSHRVNSAHYRRPFRLDPATYPVTPEQMQWLLEDNPLGLLQSSLRKSTRELRRRHAAAGLPDPMEGLDFDFLVKSDDPNRVRHLSPAVPVDVLCTRAPELVSSSGWPLHDELCLRAIVVLTIALKISVDVAGALRPSHELVLERAGDAEGARARLVALVDGTVMTIEGTGARDCPVRAMELLVEHRAERAFPADTPLWWGSPLSLKERLQRAYTRAQLVEFDLKELPERLRSSPDELDAFLDGLPRAGLARLRDLTMLAVGLATGGRPTEIRLLRRLPGELWFVRDSIQLCFVDTKPGVDHQPVPIRHRSAVCEWPLTEACAACLLTRQLAMLEKFGYEGDMVFPNTAGAGYRVPGADVLIQQSLYTSVLKLGRSLGHQMVPQSMRASFMTHHAELGTPMADIMGMLGHKNGVSTSSYDRILHPSERNGPLRVEWAPLGMERRAWSHAGRRAAWV